MKHLIILAMYLTCLLSYSQENTRGSIVNKVKTNTDGVKRALVIGVSEYFSKKLKLNYADNDAYLFKDYLSKIEKISDENINFLVNEDATSIQIMDKLAAILSSTVSGDIVYIYFAGHGDVVNKFDENEGFLLTAEANSNQEYYSGGVIPLALLDKIINKITNKGAKVILVLDACRSGFIYKEGTLKNMSSIQAMFENSSKFLSCGPNELSYESSEYKHGYFTYFLVKALVGNADINKDNNLQYNEIDDYLYSNVNNTVSKKFNQNQIPIVRTENARAIYKSIISEDKTMVFSDIQNKTKTNANLSRGSLIPVSTNEETNQLLKKFNSAVDKKDYFGKSLSAFELYKIAQINPHISIDIINQMKTILVNKLATNPQKLINQYIEGSNELPGANEFLIQVKSLEICLLMMDKDDFLIDRIYTNKLLLESYASIRSKNYFGHRNAKSKLNEALKIQPRAAYIHNALGLIYNFEEKFDSAHYHFQEAKILIKTWSAPVNNMSESLINQYKYDEAKELLNKSLGLSGSKTQVFSKLGEIYENEGMYHKAEIEYKKALNESPNDAFILKKLSDLTKYKGNLIESSKWFESAIKKDSSNTILNYGILKHINEKKIDLKTAENMFMSALESNPFNSEIYSQYADFLRINKFNSNRLILSDSLYTQAIKNNPFNVSAYAGKGLLYFKLRKKKEAITIFEEGINKNITKPQSYYFYANFLNENIKDYTNAKINYLKAIEKDKFYLPAYKMLVELYNSQKQESNSIKLLTTFLNKNPENTDLWDLLGNTYFLNGNYNEAINSYMQAIKVDSTYSNSYLKLGHSKIETKQYDSAKKSYLLANASNPNQNKKQDISFYIINLAKNKVIFGIPSEAKELFKLAYEIDSSINTTIIYSEHLYLNSDPNVAFTLLVDSLKQVLPKEIKIQLLELLIKITIDIDKRKECVLYLKKLIEINPNPDNLLMATYFNYIGDKQGFNNFMAKVNPNILTLNKLKSVYSKNTIKKYILEF